MNCQHFWYTCYFRRRTPHSKLALTCILLQCFFSTPSKSKTFVFRRRVLLFLFCRVRVLKRQKHKTRMARRREKRTFISLFISSSCVWKFSVFAQQTSSRRKTAPELSRFAYKVWPLWRPFLFPLTTCNMPFRPFMPLLIVSNKTA